MGGEVRDGVELTNLDEPLCDGPEVTKGDLVDYLDAVADRLLPDSPAGPCRSCGCAGQAPFMQRNVPKDTPDWVRTVAVWAEASHREVHQALCDDRRTLLWLANQRAVEYHVPFFGPVPRRSRPAWCSTSTRPRAPASSRWWRPPCWCGARWRTPAWPAR